MKCIILTSTFLRHQFFVNYLAAHLEIVGVWQEEKSFQPQRYAQNDDEHRIIAEHFDARDTSEHHYFHDHAALRLPPGATHRQVAAGTINDPTEIQQMASLASEIVLVFGTGLLREPLIEALHQPIINLHLGLSPYYRGSGTNFWPLVNREPEYVGATLHYLDVGIDTGPIIAHVRPTLEVSDGPHDIGNKTIQAAANMMVRVAHAQRAGTVRALPQTDQGRLYRRKDFTAGAVLQLYQNFATGMIAEYLEHKAERDAPLGLHALEGVV